MSVVLQVIGPKPKDWTNINLSIMHLPDIVGIHPQIIDTRDVVIQHRQFLGTTRQYNH